MNEGLIKEWRLLLFGFLMMFWSSPGQTYLISLFSAEIRSEFGLSHGEFGGIYSLGTLASAAVILWSGQLVDRFDLRKLSLVVISMLAVACLVLAFGTGIATLVLGMFMLRQFGQGLMSHIAIVAVVRYIDHARGKATAAASIGFALAEAVLPAAVIFSIAMVGWRDSWKVIAVVLMLIMIPATWYLLRHHHHRHTGYLHKLAQASSEINSGAVKKQWNRQEVLRDRRFYFALPTILAPSFFFTGFFFHQVHLVAVKGWELQWWGKMFAVYAGVSLASSLITGPLVDRFGAARLLPYSILPLALAFLVLSFSSQEWVGIAFLSLTGVTTGWVPTVLGPFWAEVYGVLNLGSLKALSTAIMVLSSAMSPVLLGWLFDINIDVGVLALGSAIIIAAASSLCFFAYRDET